jgi:glycine cleavage system transcriptional repressor
MEYLALTILGGDQTRILGDLTELVGKYECNVLSSQVNSMGASVGILMLLSGSWGEIAKMEAGLGTLEKKLDCKILTRRTQLANYDIDLLPYTAEVTTLDQPGVVAEITQFFVYQNIIINDLKVKSYTSHLTSTLMLTLTLSLGIPADTSIGDLRERFLFLCDELNFDGALEPEKN